MDFDARLEALLDAHGLRPRGSRRSRLQEAVVALWRAIPEGAPVLVWGDEEHTAELLSVVRGQEKKIAGIVSDDPDARGRSAHGFPLVSPAQLDGLHFELIVVSSFRRRAEINAEARRRFPGCDILDVYDVLERRGALAKRRGFPFYSCGEYLRIFELRQEHERAVDADTKRDTLHDLLAMHFEIRDFVYGLAYAREYVALGHDRDGSVAGFLQKVQSLLAELQATLGRRRHDVGVFLVDAIRMRDVLPVDGVEPAMPFLRAFSRQALTFSKAFSPTLYTLPGVPCMLTGKLPLDDRCYDMRSIRVDESALLAELSRQGYAFYNFISWKDFFAGEGRVTPVRARASYDERPLLSKAVAPRLLWALACRLAMDGTAKTFSLLHLFYETHDPHVCGHHRREPVHHLFYEYLAGEDPGPGREEYRSQLLECLRYVDTQLEFYFALLPEAMVQVVCSDHGQAAERILEAPEEIGALLSWHDERTHVALMVRASGVKAARFDGLFSMLDLGRVILGAVHGAVSMEPRAYVPIQCDPIYNTKIREIFASIGCARHARGFKALRGEQDKYVLYDNGDEEYYVLPDERHNRIQDADVEEGVRRIRARMTDRTFPDFGTRERTS